MKQDLFTKCWAKISCETHTGGVERTMSVPQVVIVLEGAILELAWLGGGEGKMREKKDLSKISVRKEMLGEMCLRE